MSSPRGQIVELDGLRGIAILAVVFNHEWPRQGGWWSPIDAMANAGWLGVDLFFVVSGFLICGILIDSNGAPAWMRNFYARRSLRIFPLYYAFLLAIFILLPLKQGGPYFQTPWLQATGTPLWYFAYLTNFRQAFTGIDVPGLIRPLWSLAIEEQFYLFFPLTILLLGVRRIPRVLGALVLLAFAFRVAMWRVAPANHELEGLLTPARMDLIAFGCLAAFVVRSRAWPRLAARADLALGAALLLLAATGVATGFNRTVPLLRTVGYSAIAMSGLVIVLWCLARRGRSSAAPLRMRWLTRFGTLCYGIYILHDVVASATTHLLARLDPAGHVAPAVRFLIVIAAIYVVAELSWRWFEGPINRLKRRFASRTDWHEHHASVRPLVSANLVGEG